MSDDFDFNADDLFDDDFDDFEDDNDFGGDNSADDFGDDDFGADLDLDFMDDDDEFGDDLDNDISAEAVDSGGPGISRGVMILGGGMLVILIIFLLLIMFLVFRGDNGFSATSTAIALTNDEINTQIAASATQGSLNVTGTQEAIITGTAEAVQSGTLGAQTQIAVDFQVTSAALTQSVLDETATFDAQETANAQATAGMLDLTAQSDIHATETEISFQMTLNPNVTVPPLSTTAPVEETVPVEAPTLNLPAVAQTATALAELFSTQPTAAPVEGTPIAQITEAPGTTTGTTTGSTTGRTALPETGIADDLFQMFGDPRLAILAAFGLLGLIVVSRGLRSANRKHDDD